MFSFIASFFKRESPNIDCSKENIVYDNQLLVATKTAYETDFDIEKTCEIALKHFIKRGDNMGNRTVMELFLRDYFSNSNIALVKIIKFTDWHTGLASYKFEYKD